MSNEEVLRALKARFEKNLNRHKGLEWAKYKQSWKRPWGLGGMGLCQCYSNHG